MCSACTDIEVVHEIDISIAQDPTAFYSDDAFLPTKSQFFKFGATGLRTYNSLNGFFEELSK